VFALRKQHAHVVLQASSCCGLINCRSGHAQIGSTALDVAMPGRRSSVSRDARSSGQRVDADRRGPAGSAFGRHPRAYTVCTVSTVSNREPRQSRWRYFTPRRGLGISRIPADGPDAGSALLERSRGLWRICMPNREPMTDGLASARRRWEALPETVSSISNPLASRFDV